MNDPYRKEPEMKRYVISYTTKLMDHGPYRQMSTTVMGVLARDAQEAVDKQLKLLEENGSTLISVDDVHELSKAPAVEMPQPGEPGTELSERNLWTRLKEWLY